MEILDVRRPAVGCIGNNILGATHPGNPYRFFLAFRFRALLA